MRTLPLGRASFCVCAAVAVISGCSVATNSAYNPALQIGSNEMPSLKPPVGTYSVLFRFDFNDGWEPLAGLTLEHGRFYGTTAYGGVNCRFGCGTVFTITSSGAERTILHFRGVYTGVHPQTGLAVLNDVLYGTTKRGGTGREGTVFSITAGGKERVIYSFKRFADGAQPNALTVLDGALYGTTYDGGAYGYGTVFRVTPTGQERLLYSFRNRDGIRPAAGLTMLNGKLYGTTEEGGPCCGTVFSITSNGRLRVLYRFKATNDGHYSHAALTVLNGTLYGTTTLGGVYDYGSIFSVTPAGKERVLYSFKGGKDGAGPTALTFMKGMFYGTTQQGFKHAVLGCKGFGCGTIFNVTAAGDERVLYTFKGGGDGETPSDLTSLKGTLYGTTAAGGGTSCGAGCGTVFAFRP